MNNNRTAFDPVYNINPCKEVSYDIPTYDLTGQMIWRLPEKKCTCGAKHTSFPQFHLDWCDLDNKTNK